MDRDLQRSERHARLAVGHAAQGIRQAQMMEEQFGELPRLVDVRMWRGMIANNPMTDEQLRQQYLAILDAWAARLPEKGAGKARPVDIKDRAADRDWRRTRLPNRP